MEEFDVSLFRGASVLQDGKFRRRQLKKYVIQLWRGQTRHLKSTRQRDDVDVAVLASHDFDLNVASVPRLSIRCKKIFLASYEIFRIEK